MPPTAAELTPRDRYRGCLLGLACGDAVGTTVEFSRRGSFAPLTDMLGGGPFRLQPGEWTDDTSMALCLGESLLECRGFDARDQMERYCRWWRTGHLSHNGRCFDIGGTVRAALVTFERTGEPMAGSIDPHAAGNGAIMRLAPVPMFFAPDGAATLHHAGESSRTTHGCDEAVDACRLLAAVLLRALGGASKEEILAAGRATGLTGHGGRPLAPAIAEIAAGGWKHKSEGAIRGSGYVVESLEAALWCFAKTGSFREAILRAANLGDDADTTAAVCGQIAGAHYGAAGIPPEWMDRLAWRERIEAMADALRAGGDRAVPFPRSYWADPGRLLAGCYPGDLDSGVAECKVRGLLECGVRTVINLTEEFETGHKDRAFVPYTDLLERFAADLGVEATHQRLPIRDLNVPAPGRMEEIQAAIDASLAAGRPVYVHCWGGRGRTGTVVGVYLIRRGLATEDDFVEVMAELRRNDPGGGAAPENAAQIGFVRRFVGGA